MEKQKIKMIRHDGGKRPVELGTNVLVKYETGLSYGLAGGRNWDSVKYYAVVELELEEPKHSTIVPQEVWAVLPEWVTCATSDSSGVWCYKSLPHYKDKWRTNNTPQFYIEITEYKGVKPATCDWKDSLVYKPGCEPKGNNNE